MTARIDVLRSQPYELLARLRAEEPVAWIEELQAWLITRRDLAVEAMRDPETFTVDDPRFSTAAVLGQSMLSLEGDEHTRHRQAFAEHFRPAALRANVEDQILIDARRLVVQLIDGQDGPDGMAELRSAIAGPLAVRTIMHFLGLVNVDPDDVLRWYHLISDAIVEAAVGAPIGPAGEAAIADLYNRVGETIASPVASLLRTIAAEAILAPDELASETAVVMFGAIETSEGMTANVLWHLLKHPPVLDAVRSDRNLVAAAIEESLRLEPAAATIDRYTTREVEIGEAVLAEGDMVTISLLGANRDPDVFPDPDRFDIERADLRQHVTFAQGPHACIGLHLARLETAAAVNAVLDLLPNVELIDSSSSSPEGLIFRKPAAVSVRWS